MFRGSIVALVTPMRADGELDHGALERLLEFHLASGTSGVVIAGTTGEAPTLDPDELEDLVARAVAICGDKIPVIGGSGTNCTRKTTELTRRVARGGAKAALVVTPYYNKPPQRGMAAHYRSVADDGQLPIILYNVPGRTGCDLLPETVAELAAHQGIMGLKEATPDLKRLEDLRKACPEEFCLLSGDDATALGFMLGGGDGVISVTANVAPRLMRGMCEAALGGEARKARLLNDRMSDLHAALFCEPNPIPVKWGVWRLGLIEPGIRLPLAWLSPEHEGRVLDAMAAAGLDVSPTGAA
jgi:4-hydroxy-tetrahydrodipicolinate synthase